MIEVRHGGRRRIDRVLDPAFLRGLQGLPLDELRSRRDDAAQEETDLSYLRRLLQGRMDLVRAELRHRGGEPGTTVDELPTILGVGVVAAAHGSGRFQTVNPSRTGEHRRAAEALAGDPQLSDVTSLDDRALDAALTSYREEEASVSDRRHQVQLVMDTCNAEIGRRYREGDASVDGLLAAERAHPGTARGVQP
jgi:hypothetical protein